MNEKENAQLYALRMVFLAKLQEATIDMSIARNLCDSVTRESADITSDKLWKYVRDEVLS